jgi:hypothetical protein
MNKKNSISEGISIALIVFYFSLNIISAIFQWPIYFYINKRIAITIIILLCNILIYVLLKNRILNKILLFYWIFVFVMHVASIVRLFYPLSPLAEVFKKVYTYSIYIISANFLFHWPGVFRYQKVSINNGTIFFCFTAILFIILYSVKVFRKK